MHPFNRPPCPVNFRRIKEGAVITKDCIFFSEEIDEWLPVKASIGQKLAEYKYGFYVQPLPNTENC